MCSLTTSHDRLGIHLLVCLAFLTVACALTTPVRAGALEMAWPLERAAECVLAFGAPYPSGDGSATHRGADLAAEADSLVLAPAEATVSFVGTVPAVGGGTVTALTLATGDGVSITLLPLSAVEVRRGDRVTVGAVLGAVAAAGDGSTDAAHLHVGVRRGDVYLDPATVLTSPAEGTDSSEAAAPEASATTVSESSASPVQKNAMTTAAAPRSSGQGCGAVAQATEGAQSAFGSSAEALSAGTSTNPEGVTSDAGSAASPAPHPLSQRSVQPGQALGASTAKAARPPASSPVPGSGSSSVAARAAHVASRLTGTLGVAWSAAVLGTLIGLAALWPVVRRREQMKEQPQVGIAPGGSDVAAAAGGC